MERDALLTELLARTREPVEILANLSTFGRGGAMPSAWLEAKHVASILDRYLSAELTVADVEVWAKAVEGRDDIGRDPGDKVGVALDELANAMPARPLAAERATTLRDQLRCLQQERDRSAEAARPKRESSLRRWAKIIVASLILSVVMTALAIFFGLIKFYLNGNRFPLELLPSALAGMIRPVLKQVAFFFVVMLVLQAIGGPRPRLPH